MEGHHLCADTFHRVHILLDGDELHAQGWVDHFKVLADLKIVAPEPGQVFHDHGRDLARFDQFLHLLEARTVKGRAADAVVIEELRMKIPMLAGIVHKDGALILDGI